MKNLKLQMEKKRRLCKITWHRSKRTEARVLKRSCAAAAAAAAAHDEAFSCSGVRGEEGVVEEEFGEGWRN